jgi:peptidoglycan hydrolase-like protein with peptidoglycan-binding domain
VKVSNVQLGDSNLQVGLVQKALRAEGLYTYSVDGKFGTNTKFAYAAWQRRCGYTGAAADGSPGIKTLTLLGNKYKFLVTS